jgi:hypothetical protein
MSANELEDLMSQLNTDSQNAFDIHDLGITAQGWSYSQEEYYTRHGRERGHWRGHGENREFEAKPLKKNYDRSYSAPKPYIPSIGEFVVDDQPNAEYYKLPTKLNYYDVQSRQMWEIDTLWNAVLKERQSLTIEQVWALFWNEHWQKQTLQKKFNNIRNSRNYRHTFGDHVHVPDTASISVFPPIPQHSSVTNGGPPHANSSHTETGAAKRDMNWATAVNQAKHLPPPPRREVIKPSAKPAALPQQTTAKGGGKPNALPQQTTAKGGRKSAALPHSAPSTKSRERAPNQQASATSQQPRTPRKTFVTDEEGFTTEVRRPKGDSRD